MARWRSPRSSTSTPAAPCRAEALGKVNVNGGTIAPGNSNGTIRISGDLTMEPESDYTVEINGSASDGIEVGFQ